MTETLHYKWDKIFLIKWKTKMETIINHVMKQDGSFMDPNKHKNPHYVRTTKVFSAL